MKTWASQVAQWWRILLPKQETQETWLWSLGREDSFKKKMAPHTSILAGKLPGQRSLAGCIPWGLEELDMTQQLSTHACIWKFNHVVVLLLRREVRLTTLGDRTKLAAFTQTELFMTLRKNVYSIVRSPVVQEEVKGRGKGGINLKSGAFSREQRRTEQGWKTTVLAAVAECSSILAGRSRKGPELDSIVTQGLRA